jgi:bla regulator protein blaR1
MHGLETIVPSVDVISYVLPVAMPCDVDEEQLQAVLLHEMPHFARRDHWVGVAQRMATVLFWWNPLVY